MKKSMNTSKTQYKGNASGLWFVIFAAMLWGTTGTAQSFAPAGATPMAVGTIRLVVGGFALLVLALLRKQLFDGKKWPLFATFVSAFFVAAYQLFFFAAVAKTGVAVGTMVAIGSSPVAAGILGALIRKESLDRKWYIATALAVIGCVLLSLSGGSLSLNLFGILLAFGAGFSYALYTVTIKGLLDVHSPDAVMAIVFSFAAILLLPTFLFYDWQWIFQPQGLLVSLHLGVFTAAISYWLFARGLKTVKVGNVATLSLAEPLTASLLGVFVLHEHLGVLDLAGVGLIFTGIAILALAPMLRRAGVASDS